MTYLIETTHGYTELVGLPLCVKGERRSVTSRRSDILFVTDLVSILIRRFMTVFSSRVQLAFFDANEQLRPRCTRTSTVRTHQQCTTKDMVRRHHPPRSARPQWLITLHWWWVYLKRGSRPVSDWSQRGQVAMTATKEEERRR